MRSNSLPSLLTVRSDHEDLELHRSQQARSQRQHRGTRQRSRERQKWLVSVFLLTPYSPLLWSTDEDGGYSGHHRDDDAQDMWDDIDTASSKTFDLADFSAATLKFSTGNTVKLSEATALYSKEGDDAMASLMKDDPIRRPKEEPEKKTSEETKLGNERGRNLLLQVSLLSPSL
jgi:hypothetical protein